MTAPGELRVAAQHGDAARPMRADARRNYQALLNAAAAAFAEHGADDVSLEEVARRAGVGIGTLYRHFPTRQALLEAVYRDQVEGLCARADELLATAPPGEALTAWLRSLVQFSSTKRSLTSAMLATLGQGLRARFLLRRHDPAVGGRPAHPRAGGRGGAAGCPLRRT